MMNANDLNTREQQQTVYINTGKNNSSFDLSVFPVNSNKIPFGKWKQFQSEIPPVSSWKDHFLEGGYVGIVTGQVSKNLEVIDIDSKNDPNKTINEDYTSIIPNEILSKLIIQRTPSGGLHLIYRCQEVTINGNHKLAETENGETLIETRGEAGYICHHLRDYQVKQGIFNLVTLDLMIPELSATERETLLSLARSLDRKRKNKISDTFSYKEPAINQFNVEFNIIDLFKKHGWTIFKDDDKKITLTRPDSNALYSGYYYKDSKIFFCFSTSTDFKPQHPYNHFQILQLLEGKNDYRTTLRLLENLGYQISGKQERVTVDDIAEYLNNIGVRQDTFRQDIIYNGQIITETLYNTIYLDMNKHFDKEIPRTRFETIIKSDYISKYNPIIEFINNHADRKPVGTFDKWLDCITLENENVNRSTVKHFFKKWYVGSIAQALDGEYPNEFFLCLLSTEQGIGKTTLLRKYTLPEELHDYCAEHSLCFDDDYKVLMGQTLLLIDDEMDGRSYEQEKTFKTILSTKEVTTRRKYDRRISKIKRRASFAGSGNNLSVVRERQNRRVIPIEIQSINRELLPKIDYIDLFMEAYHLYKSGFVYSYQFSDKKLLEELYTDYVQQSDVDLVLDQYISHPINDQDVYYLSNLDLVSALSKEFPQFSKRINVPTIGKKMIERGFKSKRKGYKKISCYEISSVSMIRTLINTYSQSYEINKEFGYSAVAG